MVRFVGVQLLGVLHEQVDLLMTLGLVDQQQGFPAQAAELEQRFLVSPAAVRFRENRFEPGEVAVDFLEAGLGHACGSYRSISHQSWTTRSQLFTAGSVIKFTLGCSYRRKALKSAGSHARTASSTLTG